MGIAVDGSGHAFVTGLAGTYAFPTTPGAFQTVCNGNLQSGCAFVSEFNPSGSALVYSTYLPDQLGGSFASGITVDASGNFYVIGFAGVGFPTTPGAFQTKYVGTRDAFVTKFVPGDQVWPLALDLGGQPLGHTSKTKTTVLSNSNQTTLNITKIQITGTNSQDFAETNDCPASLPAGQSCTISAKFTPHTQGRGIAVSPMERPHARRAGDFSTVLRMAQRGWRLFPIKEREKQPLIADWPNQATNDKSRLFACSRRMVCRAEPTLAD